MDGISSINHLIGSAKVSLGYPTDLGMDGLRLTLSLSVPARLGTIWIFRSPMRVVDMYQA